LHHLSIPAGQIDSPRRQGPQRDARGFQYQQVRLIPGRGTHARRRRLQLAIPAGQMDSITLKGWVKFYTTLSIPAGPVDSLLADLGALLGTALSIPAGPIDSSCRDAPKAIIRTFQYQQVRLIPRIRG